MFNPTTLTTTLTNLEGQYYADQYATGSGNNGISNLFTNPATCSANGCYVIAPPVYSSAESYGPYGLSAPRTFTSFPSIPMSIFADDRGYASARFYRDPVQFSDNESSSIWPLNNNGGHTGLFHNCLFSTPVGPYEPNGGGTCLSINMAGDNYGFSYGNPTWLPSGSGLKADWSVGAAVSVNYTNVTPGIHRGLNVNFRNQGIGDTMGSYYYTYTSGGVTAASDEGFKAIAGGTGETASEYSGTVSGTTTTNPQGLPVVTTTPGSAPSTLNGGSKPSVNGSQGDGSYLIDTQGASLGKYYSTNAAAQPMLCTITAYSISNNIVTLTCNNFQNQVQVGAAVQLSGFTVATFLNDISFIVQSASESSFSGSFTYERMSTPHKHRHIGESL